MRKRKPITESPKHKTVLEYHFDGHGIGGSENMVEFSDYAMGVAGTEAAVDIFSDGWVTNFSSIGLPNTGNAKLLDDSRIRWLSQHMKQSFKGYNVLELGSLEGAHSYTFLQHGAKSVTGIEANSQHFLKSLIVQNHLAEHRMSFLLGDFVSFMAQSDLSYDLVSACGVLYHMTNPAEVIAAAAKRAPRLFIWTVLFDDEKIPDGLRPRLTGPETLTHDGFSYTGRKHSYGLEKAQNLHKSGLFSGGSEQYSVWLEYDELVRVIEHYGYRVVDALRNEEPNPLHGGNVTLYAELAV